MGAVKPAEGGGMLAVVVTVVVGGFPMFDRSEEKDTVASPG